MLSKINKKEDPGFFGLVSFRYLPYWPLFLIILVICISLAFAYIKFATPLYQASAAVMVYDEKKGVNDTRAKDALSAFNSPNIAENEIEVLRSTAIMNEVVRELHLYAPIYEVGTIFKSSAYQSSPVIIEAQDPAHIADTLLVSFKMNAQKEVVIGNNVYPMNKWVKTPFGVLQFKPNPKKVKDPANPLAFSLFQVKEVTASNLLILQTNAASKLSTVIYLAIKDEVPQKAEDILNKILETYDLFSIRQKNKIADNTLAFVQDRLHYVESDLDSIESTIQRFKSREKVTNLGEQGRLYLQSVGDNDNKTANISVQMAVLDQVEKFVLGNDNKASIIPASFGINDPVLSSMLQSLRDDELKYDILVKTAGENNPSAVTIAREIENLRPQLMQVLRNQRSALEASRNQLANNKGIYDSQLISLPQKERQLLDISRRQNIKNDVYTFLLQKREETALSYASTVADSWIISPAQSTYLPVWPNKIFVLLIAIVLSVLISAGLVTKKEVMNKKVLFRNEISEVTNVPIVAELFNVKRKKRLAVTQDKGSVIAEQLRKLRASVGIYGNNTSIKKILITSSISGEGKSFVSSNLGLNLAFSGKKVLLMDLDLRNPMISSIVGMEGGPGISDYLEGKCQTHEIVFTTSHKNLYAISAGSEAVNPTELLLNGKIGDLLNELDKEFDYIIMDTSPIASVSDAYLLSEYCDITLFLVKHRFTPKKLVQMLEENIRSKALRNVYIVFNGIKPRGMFTKKYGYGYGYGYEYVYKIKRRKSTRHAVIA